VDKLMRAQRKLSVPVLLAVASRNLIDVSRFDGVLAALISREWRPATIDFASRFIAQCLVATPPAATREQLVQTLDTLVQAAENGKATELCVGSGHRGLPLTHSAAPMICSTTSVAMSPRPSPARHRASRRPFASD
jgi:hypothetical protein